jgi:hypothetical protein
MKRIYIFIAAFLILAGIAYADYDVWITTNIRQNVTNFVVTPSTFNGNGIFHSVAISSACAGTSYLVINDSRNTASGSPARLTQFVLGPIGGGSQFQYFYDLVISSGITITTSGLPNVPIGCGYELQYKIPIR